MNLIKNVDADWDAAKGRVRQDLDTIQRNYNAMQARLDALFKQVNTVAPAPAAVISAANTVTTYDTDFLRSVATIPRGGLLGNGTITNPLGVSVDGSTISINSDGQLVGAAASGLITDPTGALGGDGTVPSPLAVLVDGSTIQINGSNQLTAPGVSPFQLFQTAFIINYPVNLTLNSVPPVAVAGVAGMVIVPIWWSMRNSKAGVWTNGGSPLQLCYTNFAGVASNLANLTSGFSGAAALDTFAFASGYNQTITSGNPIPTGQSLVIASNADIISNVGASASLSIQVAYVIVPG